MKIKTNPKAGALSPNHNEIQVRDTNQAAGLRLPKANHQLRSYRKALLCATGVLAILPLTSASAQLLGTPMRADVPFQFIAGEQVLPAGTYLVYIDRITHAMVFENETNYAALTIAAAPAFRKEKDVAKGRLEFTDYGASHFLRKIWLMGESKGAVLLQTKREREFAKLATPVHTASIASE